MTLPEIERALVSSRVPLPEPTDSLYVIESRDRVYGWEACLLELKRLKTERDSVMELAQKVADCKNAVDEISPKDFYLLSAMKARMELTKSIDALAAALPRKS